MKKISLILLLFFFAGAALTAKAAPKGPAHLKNSVKQTLLNVYAEEVRKFPQLKNYLESESDEPFQTLFRKVQRYNASKAKEGKRKTEGIDDPGPIQSAFFKGAKAKNDFSLETGITPLIQQPASSQPTLTPQETVKQALESVFAEEIKDYPTLKDFLRNEKNQPFKEAWEKWQGLPGKNLSAITEWIRKEKSWYGTDTGIGDHMFENSNAPQDEETRREFIARAFPGEAVPAPPPAPDLTITDFHPKTGYIGDIVHIEGTNLGYTTGVRFQGSTADEFQSGGPTTLTVFVPPGAATGPITLHSNSGEVATAVPFKIWSGQCSNKDLNRAFNQLRKRINGEGNQGDCDIKKYNNGRYSNFRELRNHVKNVVGMSPMPKPAIQSLEPPFGPPGTKVTVKGENLDIYADEIRFAGSSVPFQFVNETRLSFNVPYNASPGEKEVTLVSDLHGQGKGNFKVAPAPEISGVNPNPVEPNSSLTISGNFFDEIRSVEISRWGSMHQTEPANFTKVDANQLRFTAPVNQGKHYVAVSGKFGRSNMATFFVSAKAPKPEPPKPITVNPQGHPEYCFGAVGNGCGGFGEGAGDAVTRPAWLGAGCHAAKGDGTRDCWVVQGSIMHDNCCVKNPFGQMCGGTYSDGSKAGFTKHDGNCVKEWADAMWDVAHGHAWLENFRWKEPADLTPAGSDRYRPGETPESARLCAADKTNVTDREPSPQLYCCSGQGQRYWAVIPTTPPVVEKWLTCGPPPKKPWFGILSVDQKQKGKSKKAIRVDQPPPPIPVAYLEELSPSKKKRMIVQPMTRQSQPSFDEPLITAPPPPPPPKKYEAPAEGRYEAPEETVWRRPPAEPEPEPSSAEGQPCVANVPRYRQKGCVEASLPQEEVQPQECERGSWSPTLKRCVE